MPILDAIKDEASSMETASRVHNVIRARVRRPINNFQVAVEAQEVVVRGTVQNFYTKQLVTHAVLSEMPEYSLNNSLLVE
jgi:hypothetical protein